MPFHDQSEFLRLSATINYQLFAAGVGVENICAILVPEDTLPEEDRAVLVEVLEYLRDAYGESRRRLGPLAILHPIRTAALLSRTCAKPDLLDLLTALLHDKLEDIGRDKVTGAPPQDAERRFERLVERLSDRRRWFLMERVAWLTRKEDGETYHQYMGRLLDKAQQTPEILRVKLADRLDNTLDMRVAVEDPVKHIDFYELLFQLLFVKAWTGPKAGVPKHPSRSPLDGAQRLYQLYKNTITLSLIRRAGFPDRADPVVASLFDAVARASILEAQRIVVHIFTYHVTGVPDQRSLLMDVLRYCQRGGATEITMPEGENELDGFFIRRFEHSDPDERKRQVARLYDDKRVMARAAVTLISTFQSFLDDPSFSVRGVTPGGCVPVPHPSPRGAGDAGRDSG